MNLDVGRLGSILGVWAHPDDEAYLMGGVVALAAGAGQTVACVTATLGDAGETADADRWPRERLRQIRRAELDACLTVLGIGDHECLDLPDGRLAQVDAAGPVARITETIHRVRPDTLITFGPDGMTGHPDHCAVSAWVDAAVADAGRSIRVLWSTKTPDWTEAFMDVNAKVFPPGLPPVTPQHDAWVLDLDEPDLDRKLRALAAHASQTTGLADLVGAARYAEWVRLEAFRPAGPAARP